MEHMLKHHPEGVFDGIVTGCEKKKDAFNASDADGLGSWTHTVLMTKSGNSFNFDCVDTDIYVIRTPLRYK